MSKRRMLNIARDPTLDIVSYGRRGPGSPRAFSREQVEQIGRTVRRTPERSEERRVGKEC